MKVYASKEIKEWDRFSIEEEGIQSFQLMQRAAASCFRWIQRKYTRESEIDILCGPGNNGGDGLLVAAYLFQRGYTIACYAIEGGASIDRQLALDYAEKQGLKLYPLSDYSGKKEHLLIDALFGHGMTRPLQGEFARLVKGINELNATVISIDIPSGMPSEAQNEFFPLFIRAKHIVSFQQPKQSFFLDEYGSTIASWELLDIGLSQAFSADAPVLLDERETRSRFIEKPRFSHKGTFGSTLLIGGALHYPGAISLFTLGALASGVGKTFVACPDNASETCKTLAPEAIYLPNCGQDILSLAPNLSPYDSVGIGPGLGMDKQTEDLVLNLFSQSNRWVIDADALNILAKHPDVLPKGEVLITPHPGEFDRLTHTHSTTGARWKTAQILSKDKGWVVVLKGAYTSIFFPDGRQFINSSGNAGLAKGGSGDVLCGLITGLLARGYSVEDGALIAVYLHGLAADRLSLTQSKDGIKAQELIPAIETISKQWEN